ncbi:hypothetical protein E4U26_001429 [Claviceps purpurea]|nr:hypothetical protein E4U26_001429 [Claviceps purpurea]
MDTPFNHPPSVELFNGSGDITSWLKKFRRAYRRANGNRDPGPSDLIQAMDSALTGDATTFVGNSTLLSHIVDQADKFAATTEDLALFESTLQDHYVVKTEVGIGHDSPFPNVAQIDGESIDTYHGRVLAAFRARGGRDKPVSSDQPPLTLYEATGVNEWIHRFVLGLLDKVLLAESINQGALSSDSLRSALQIVKKANSLLEVKSNMARAMTQQARLSMIDGWFRQQLGHSANKELTRAYGLPNTMLDSWGGPQEQAMSVDTLMSQLQPSMAALGISGGGWNRFPQLPQTHFAPQQGHLGWPQQANVFQFSAGPQPNTYAPSNAAATATAAALAIAPAPAPAPVFAPVPVPGSAPALAPAPVFATTPAPAPVFAPAPVPVRARNATVDVSDWCPPMEHEETEVAVVEDITAVEDVAAVEDVITVEDVVAVEDVAAVEDVITVEDVVVRAFENQNVVWGCGTSRDINRLVSWIRALASPFIRWTLTRGWGHRRG